ncbi:hypothetical protein F7100_14900, partial [Dickeya dianthicola]|nr:hypothetical protein [Dickeya dianthicola]MBI0450334.1 hypothetical protein [Dickeya dianthicola]MBI0454861.1 hypothetical protein [Dickeya dianthicola]MBI0458176.1 hypothetical protein [Dickeya dianthicola]MBI0463699.1 hypothetical protein [Dickeya dianthicola]
EHDLAKVGVASSSLVSRSKLDLQSAIGVCKSMKKGRKALFSFQRIPVPADSIDCACIRGFSVHLLS